MSRRRSPLVSLFVTVFLDLLGFGMVIPILALYTKKFGVSDVAVTAMGASYSVMQLIFSTVWGRISDRYGRRPVMLISIAGAAVSQLGYALAPSFGAMVVARCFAGIFGANISAAQAYIADTTDEKGRAGGMALMGIAMGLGFVLGPFFGGPLAHAFGDTTPFFVASALSAGNFVLALATLEEPTRRQVNQRAITWSAIGRAVSSPRIRTLIVIFFVVTFGFANLEQTYPFFLQRRFGWNEKHVGYTFGWIGLVMILTQGILVRRLAPRVGERALVLVGMGTLTVGMVVSFFARDLPMLAVGTTLVSVGLGLNSPSLSSLLSRATSGDRQGSVLGVAQSAASLGRIFGPIIGGWMLRFGEGVPSLFGAAFVGAAFLFATAAVQPAETMEAVAADVRGETAG